MSLLIQAAGNVGDFCADVAQKVFVKPPLVQESPIGMECEVRPHPLLISFNHVPDRAVAVQFSRHLCSQVFPDHHYRRLWPHQVHSRPRERLRRLQAIG